MLWPKFKHHDPKKTKKAFLFKIPVPGECGARCYMAHIDQKRWKKGEEDGRRKTKTIFNT
jgi:hypothetical protein